MASDPRALREAEPHRFLRLRTDESLQFGWVGPVANAVEHGGQAPAEASVGYTIEEIRESALEHDSTEGREEADTPAVAPDLNA